MEISPQEWLRPLTEGLYFVRTQSRFAERATADALVQPIPSDDRVVAIGRALLENDAESAKALRESALSTWTSFEELRQPGNRVRRDARIRLVGHSLTAYVCGDRCEIGVEIREAHRRKGAGAHVATRAANDAFLRGIKRV